jgi:iron complex transport system substrate-binding protein
VNCRIAALSAVLILLVSTACAGRSPAAGEGGPAGAGFPVTVDNCGVAVTVGSPPTRAVGYFQHSVEMLLALDLRDAVVGSVYPDNPPLPQYAAAYESIPQISAKDASFEQILQVEPDFVYGGYASAFDGAQGRSRETFTGAGVTTYLNAEYCADGPVTMDDVYREVRTVARMFGVPERADDLVEDMAAHVEDASAKVRGAQPVDVFVYDSGDATAFTAGGQGIGNQIIHLAGGVNVFGDVPETFADVSWEQVLERSPEVIVIYDYFGTPSVEEKKNALRARPELADVPALRNDRFAVLTLQDAVLGVRAPYAVGALAEQLHPGR